MTTSQREQSYFKRGRMVLCSAVVALVCCAEFSKAVEVQVTQDDAELKIDIPASISQVEQQLAAGKVARIEVLHITSNSVFRVNVSSSLLEVGYDYKLVVQHYPSTNRFARLVNVVRQARPKASGQVADLRWGFVFYDREGRRLFGVYCDHSGRNGVINGCCVAFGSGALAKWAAANYGTLFR